MNIFKSKLLWFAPLAAILLLVIFALAFYPAFNPKPKQIPIAVVNNDKGVDIIKSWYHKMYQALKSIYLSFIFFSLC